MKRLALFLVLAGLLAPAAVRAEPHGGVVPPGRRSPGSRLVQGMAFPPFRWQVPRLGVQVQRRTLSNGVVVYLLRDSTLPRVQASLVVRGGSLHEPLERHGVALMASELQRTGGTRSHSPEELDRILEVEALDLETGLSSETSYVRLDVLRDHLSSGLELLAEVALHPRFDARQLEITREQFHESLRRRNDRPADVVNREFPHLLFGDDPEGRMLRWPPLQALGVGDLQDWHGLLWTPDRAFLAVAGDFEPEALTAELERVLGAWRPNGRPLPAPPEVGADPPAGVFLVERAVNQSSVILGHLGVSREDPDREALQVLDYILGAGSFSSRLVERVRNREGLAYSINSTVQVDTPRRGMVLVSFQTRSGATRKALDLALEEFRRIREEPVTGAELEQARASLVNSMVFRFDQPFETVRRLMGLEIQGFPADHYEAWARRLQAVTAADVQRVARRVLRPERLVTLVLGQSSAFEAPLDDLGPVRLVVPEVVP